VKIIFWTSLILIFYAYAGYPAVVYVLSRLFPKKTDKIPFTKEVSVVLAVKNEEKNIAKRINNLLNQTYAKEKTQIVVVCDGSTDGTCAIMDNFLDNTAEDNGSSRPALKLIKYAPSQGKPHAVNTGVQHSTGEIIVFADARQEFHENAISELVSNFYDPAVGCVSGELMFYDQPDSKLIQPMGIYWNYEKFIRKCESRIHSVPGATGAVYAIKKSLFKSMPEELLLDDVFIPMNIILKGHRAILDEKALAFDTVSNDFQMEKRRKVRTLLGNWQLLRIMPGILNPFNNPIFLQYVSHKVISRLITPFCFVLYIATSLFIKGWFYKSVFFSTLGLIILSFFDSAILLPKIVRRIASISRSVFSLNYFSLIGFFRFVTGKERVW
jgi:poly-beta-1,6-N-acetyl-D-glucosamine synthase